MSLTCRRRGVSGADSAGHHFRFCLDHACFATKRQGRPMEELNGRMIACQILITGLIARVANDQRDPLRFLTDFRDEIRAVVRGINIAGTPNADSVRLVAEKTVDEMFSLMKPPSTAETDDEEA